MVTDEKQDSEETPIKQGPRKASPEPNKINASTPFDFTGKNLTPYGGLLPVITMLERFGFQSLVEQTVTSKRMPRAMDLYQPGLAIIATVLDETDRHSFAVLDADSRHWHEIFHCQWRGDIRAN